MVMVKVDFNAIVGYTGLVGSTLIQQGMFPLFDRYNSKNIKDIEGKTYDKVFFSARTVFLNTFN